MTFFHFVNCVGLAYAPYIIVYKYSGLSEYTTIWKCAQATLAYFLTQLVKLLLLATFFPAGETDGFSIVPELLKSSADVVDVIGLHIAINHVMAGRSEVRCLSAGLGWAFAHSIASRFVHFWVGARATAFHWRWIQSALDSNTDLVLFVSVAGLTWLCSRTDMPSTPRRLVFLLLLVAVFHAFICQCLAVFASVRGWTLVGARAVLASSLGGGALYAYAALGSQHVKSN